LHVRFWLRTLLFALAAVLLALGCRQQEGEVCDVQQDCAEGLVCCDSAGPVGEMRTRADVRGLCVMSADCLVRARVDAGPRPDAGPVDAEVLDADVLDAEVLDAEVLDADVEDAGPDAALEDDAGVEADAGVEPDAGAEDAGDAAGG
jgi:hypothetical protein